MAHDSHAGMRCCLTAMTLLVTTTRTARRAEFLVWPAHYCPLAPTILYYSWETIFVGRHGNLSARSKRGIIIGDGCVYAIFNSCWCTLP